MFRGEGPGGRAPYGDKESKPRENITRRYRTSAAPHPVKRCAALSGHARHVPRRGLVVGTAPAPPPPERERPPPPGPPGPPGPGPPPPGPPGPLVCPGLPRSRPLISRICSLGASMRPAQPRPPPLRRASAESRGLLPRIKSARRTDCGDFSRSPQARRPPFVDHKKRRPPRGTSELAMKGFIYCSITVRRCAIS